MKIDFNMLIQMKKVKIYKLQKILKNVKPYKKYGYG